MITKSEIHCVRKLNSIYFMVFHESLRPVKAEQFAGNSQGVENYEERVPESFFLCINFPIRDK